MNLFTMLYFSPVVVGYRPEVGRELDSIRISLCHLSKMKGQQRTESGPKEVID